LSATLEGEASAKLTSLLMPEPATPKRSGVTVSETALTGEIELATLRGWMPPQSKRSCPRLGAVVTAMIDWMSRSPNSEP